MQAPLRYVNAFLRLLVISICLVTTFASARSVLDLDETRQPVALQDWGDAWVDPTGTATVTTVSGFPQSAFKPADPQKVYALKPQEALWIRFSAPAAPDNERWYVFVPNPGVDSVELYSRGRDGLWAARKAGDNLPVASWPIPHLYPVFALGVSAEEPTYYALRLKASNSFSSPIWFQNESGLSTRLQSLSLLHGLYFGLLMMVSIFAFTTALTMRDAAHALFGLWAAVSTLAIASATGIGGMHLWPRSPRWNDAAEYVLPILSLAPLLVFVALSISLRARKPRLFAGFLLLAAVMLGMAGALALAPAMQVWSRSDRVFVTLAACTGCALVCVAAIVWALSIGDRFAGWLLAGFAPMAALLILPLMYVAQWLPATPLIQHAWQASFVITLPSVFLMLVLRTQEKRNYQQRISKIDRIDPATGLVNDVVFVHRLGSQIDRSAKLNYLSMVVVIDISNRSKLLEDFGRRTVLELTLRLAQRLTTFVRDVDTVARLGEDRFGLLIEGPIPPDKATGMATKIMARFVDPFTGLPHSLNVKPKIAFALVPLDARTAEEAMAHLDALLMGASPGNRKNIFPASDYAVKGSVQP